MPAGERPKFGKKPFQGDPRDFRFSTITEGVEVPVAPLRFGHGLMYRDWMMLGNDNYGDCVFAGFAHQAMLASKLENYREPEKFNTEGVLADYGDVTGFRKDDPNTDNGAYPRDGLNYWRNTGIRTLTDTQAMDKNGIRTLTGRHKIGAFVSINPRDWEELMSAAYVFSSVGIGWSVPETIWDQWDSNEPFDVVSESARIIGGHYTVVTGRSGRSTGGMITWARRKSFTRDFYETYNDEAWAIVFENDLRAGKNERGFDLTQLNDLLTSYH